MVTLITNKLQKQTLEEISSKPEAIQNEQLRKASNERDAFDRVRKSTRSCHQHRRSHSSRNIKIEAFGQDGPKHRMTSSFPARYHSYPPARKRLCRSLSDPYKDQATTSTWNPAPSSIWTPVKPRKGDRTTSTGARSLDFTNREALSWSTPPESPIPRPVSANSALEDSKFLPLGLICKESDNRSCFSSCSGKNVERCSSLCSAMPRSHSHPSFSNVVNNGLKRRLSEVDIPRPSLDFDKMKSRCFGNSAWLKRTVKSSKHSGQRHASLSPKTPNSATKEKTTQLSPNVTVDLSSSLMITPTASPTEVACIKTLEAEKYVQQDDENANNKLRLFVEHQCFTHETVKLDTDLDIKLIEEDGTLHDDEIHNSSFLSDSRDS